MSQTDQLGQIEDTVSRIVQDWQAMHAGLGFTDDPSNPYCIQVYLLQPDKDPQPSWLPESVNIQISDGQKFKLAVVVIGVSGPGKGQSNAV